MRANRAEVDAVSKVTNTPSRGSGARKRNPDGAMTPSPSSSGNQPGTSGNSGGGSRFFRPSLNSGILKPIKQTAILRYDDTDDCESVPEIDEEDDFEPMAPVSKKRTLVHKQKTVHWQDY